MKILIWGTGRLTGEVVGEYITIENVSGFVDNTPAGNEYMGKPVYKPVELCEMEYDAVCVATIHAKAIYEQCMELGLDMSRFIFLYNYLITKDLNRNYELMYKVFGQERTQKLQNRYQMIRGVEAYGQLFLQEEQVENNYLQSDYVRIKSLELVVKEIRKKNVSGAVAEFGVFRGEFAQLINLAFPEKRCYLFDTFEGFDETEAKRENESGNCTHAFIEAYKSTSIDIVMARMKYPEKIEIRKGFFPQTAKDLDEHFAFVSIDVDFGDSIYEGLKFFYPRLERGGYIFVHDYNSHLAGVEQAIERYESEYGDLCKMPICDAGGTLVIMK